jgi:hypothetical protein
MIAHQSVADILRDHVRLSVEGIDRMYLNVYVPQLQSEQGVVWFFKYHRGQPLPSAALMSPLSRGFVAQLERFVTERGIPLVQFRKGERKDAVMASHLRRFDGEEGVLFVGKAQEKTPVFRTLSLIGGVMRKEKAVELISTRSWNAKLCTGISEKMNS